MALIWEWDPFSTSPSPPSLQTKFINLLSPSVSLSLFSLLPCVCVRVRVLVLVCVCVCVHLAASLILSFCVPLERSLDAYLGVRLCLVCVLDEFDVREEVCMCV